MSKILSFGDSWCYGFELDKPKTECYTHLLSEKVNSEYINYGFNGNSFSKITNEILTKQINKNDFILVCIPPDIRFIGEDKNGNLISLYSDDSINSCEFIQKQMNYYKEVIVNYKNFSSYFQLLNLYSLQNYLSDLQVNFLFFVNYGNIDYKFKFNGKIDKSNFLINKSLTNFLGGNDLTLTPSKLNTDNIETSIFKSKYFKGNLNHPNKEGHEKIADLIYNNSKFQKWLT